MSNLTLPRIDEEGVPYLSYSQYTKWKDKPRDYIRQYFFGEPEDNPMLRKYGDFGHKVGEAYENNDFSAWEDDEAEFLQTLPCYDEFEKKIKLEMPRGYYILGYIDSNTKVEDGYVKKLLDYKTGIISKKEGDYRSDDYKQVDLYAAALQQEYGTLPDEACVVLIGRDGNAFAGEELTLTKEAVIIDRSLSQERCNEVALDFDGVAQEIAEYYEVFNKLIQKDATN